MNYLRLFIVWLISLTIVGCSSLQVNDASRKDQFKNFLSHSDKLVFYSLTQLRIDDQLRLLTGARSLDSLVRAYESQAFNEQFVSRFLMAAQIPTNNLFPLEKIPRLNLPIDTPVLFFYINSKAFYQRWPPDLNKYRLQVGVIAKVIPLGQVLNGTAKTALRTAAWEGKCIFEPFNAQFYSVDEWLAEDSQKIHSAYHQFMNHCNIHILRMWMDNVQKNSELPVKGQ